MSSIIIGMLLGFVIGAVFNRTYAQVVYDYLKSPSTDKLEINWSVYRLLELVSKPIGRRWYEARVHLKQNILISILCTMKIIDVVRLEYATDDDCRYIYKVVIFHGFRSYTALKAKIHELIPSVQKELDNAHYHYQTFIAGHNVTDW